MLLWNGCLQLRNTSSGDSEKAEFAYHAFSEANSIQDALDAHTCKGNENIINLAREYLTK